MTAIGVFRDDYYDPSCVLTDVQYVASAQNGGIIPATSLAGARKCVAEFSGQAAAQALTTDTAANIVAQLKSVIQSQVGSPVPDVAGVTYVVRIINNDNTAGVITLTGGAGVTINGTNTLAITTTRDFQVTVVDDEHVTFQNIGSGTP